MLVGCLEQSLLHVTKPTIVYRNRQKGNNKSKKKIDNEAEIERVYDDDDVKKQQQYKDFTSRLLLVNNNPHYWTTT